MDKLGRGCAVEYGKEGAGILQGVKHGHLYAHTEGTKELDLVLRDELGKCDENGSLECRLTVVVHVISNWELETDHAYVRVLGVWIAADVQEAFIANDGPLKPAKSQCDGIGDREGYRDEFERFNSSPETFEVAQTGREKQEGQ